LNLPRRAGFDKWRADRTLTDTERQRIELAIAFLRDRKNDWIDRETAATELGEWGHAMAIPVLLDVMQDEAEMPYLRVYVLVALSMIADERVVPPLIEMVAHPESGFNAREQLCKITGVGWDWGFRTDTVADPERAPEELRERWRAWWDENRGKIELDRTAHRQN
jgi:hypothetical protein